MTLIESKRQIGGDQDVQRAAAQAARYARSLGLPSFVVAAPRGLWTYRLTGELATHVAHVTALELHEAPGRPGQILLQLHADSVAPSACHSDRKPLATVEAT